ncbi:hypothetical protein [Streptomyces sp. NPDC056632]|uniref:hypothetical protein n=1 Tax=Streptomyces sp. NPDC056632 TaxID=3345884 RepID=UPI003685857C
MTPIRYTAWAARPTAGAAAALAAGILLCTGQAAATPAHPVGAVATVPERPARAEDKKVKYYIVTKQANGEPEFLFSIAEKVLGDGNRFNEIFELNKGRLQPDGLVMKTATSIAPGWILQLPPDAKGAGVKEGPLPVVTVAPPPSAAPSQGAPAAPQQQPAQTPVAQKDSGTDSSALYLGVGSALAVGGLAGTFLWRRRAARTPAAAVGAAPTSPAAPLLPAGPAGGPAGGMVPAAFLDTSSRPATTATTATTLPPASSRAPRSVAPRAATPVPPVEPDPEIDEAPEHVRPAFPPRAAVSIGAVAGAAAANRSAAGAGGAPRPLSRPGAEPSARRAAVRRGAVQSLQVEFGDDLVEVDLTVGHPSLQDTSIAWMPVPYEVPEGGAAFVCIGAAEGSGCLFLDLAQAPGMVSVGGDADGAQRLLESIVLQLSASPVLDQACATAVGDMPIVAHGIERVESVATLRELVTRREEEVDPPFEFVFCTVGSEDDTAALTDLLDGPGRVVPIVLGDVPHSDWQLNVRAGDAGSGQS